MELCCIGDLCADLLLPYGEVKQHLRRLKSGSVDYSEVIFQYGGTVGNTCAVLGKLGARPHLVSDLCRDRIGKFLSRSMAELGVDLSWSTENSEKSNMICVAVIEENNERVIFPWLPPGSGYPTLSKENLALIPGTAGAAPIQNIGAYGAQVGEFIQAVEAWDCHEQAWVRLDNEQCGFAYRDSVFKQQPDRYLITAIELKLPLLH